MDVFSFFSVKFSIEILSSDVDLALKNFHSNFKIHKNIFVCIYSASSFINHDILIDEIHR